MPQFTLSAEIKLSRGEFDNGLRELKKEIAQFVVEQRSAIAGGIKAATLEALRSAKDAIAVVRQDAASIVAPTAGQTPSGQSDHLTAISANTQALIALTTQLRAGVSLASGGQAGTGGAGQGQLHNGPASSPPGGGLPPNTIGAGTVAGTGQFTPIGPPPKGTTKAGQPSGQDKAIAARQRELEVLEAGAQKALPLDIVQPIATLERRGGVKDRIADLDREIATARKIVSETSKLPPEQTSAIPLREGETDIGANAALSQRQLVLKGLKQQVEQYKEIENTSVALNRERENILSSTRFGGTVALRRVLTFNQDQAEFEKSAQDFKGFTPVVPLAKEQIALQQLKEYQSIVNQENVIKENIRKSGATGLTSYRDYLRSFAEFDKLVSENPSLGTFNERPLKLAAGQRIKEFEQIRAQGEALNRQLESGKVVDKSKIESFYKRRQEADDFIQQHQEFGGQFAVGRDFLDQSIARNKFLQQRAVVEKQNVALRKEQQDILKTARLGQSISLSRLDEFQDQRQQYLQGPAADKTLREGLPTPTLKRGQIDARSLKEFQDVAKKEAAVLDDIASTGGVSIRKYLTYSRSFQDFQQTLAGSSLFDASGLQPLKLAAGQRIKEIQQIQKQGQALVDQLNSGKTVLDSKIKSYFQRANEAEQFVARRPELGGVPDIGRAAVEEALRNNNILITRREREAVAAKEEARLNEEREANGQALKARAKATEATRLQEEKTYRSGLDAIQEAAESKELAREKKLATEMTALTKQTQGVEQARATIQEARAANLPVPASNFIEAEQTRQVTPSSFFAPKPEALRPRANTEVQEYANLITNQAALLKQLEQSGTALGKEFYKIEQQRAQVADLFRRNPILGEFDLSAPILQSKNQLSEYTRLQAAMQSIERDLSAGRRVSDSRLATFETKRQKTEDVFKKLGIYDQFDIGPEVFNQLKAKNVGLFAQADSTGAIQRGFEDIRNKVERERTSLEKALADKGQLSIGRVGGFNQRTIAANTQTAGLGQLQQFRQVNNRQLKEVADYYSSIDKSASELSTKGTVTATKLIALGNKQREVSGQYFDAFGKELDLPKFRASIERIREVVSLQKEVQRFASQQGGVAPEKIENLTKRATTLRNVLGSFRVATDLEKFDSFINLKALQPSAALAGISSQFEALGKSIEEQRTKLKTKLSATGSLSILEIAGFNQKVSQANTQTAGLANFQQLNQLAADQVTEVQKFLKRRAGLQQALDIKGALPLGSLQRLDDDNKKLNASLKNLGINFNVPSLKVSIDQLKEVQDLEGEAKKIATLGSQATKEQITDFTQRRKNLEEILRQSNLTTDLYSKVAAGSTQQQGFLSRIGNAIRSRLGSGVGAGASGGFGGGAGGGGGGVVGGGATPPQGPSNLPNVSVIQQATGAFGALRSVINAVHSSLGELISNFGRIAVFSVAAGVIVRGFFAIESAITGVIKNGIAYNSTLEQQRLSLAAVLAVTRQVKDSEGKTISPAAAFPVFLGDAVKKQKEILVASTQTLGTQEDLQNVYERVLALSNNQKGTDDQRLQISTALVNAGKLLGLNGERLTDETRQLFTLDSQRGQVILQVLGLNVKDLRQLRDKHELLGEYVKRLDAFNVLAQTAGQSMVGLLTSVTSLLGSVGANVFSSVFSGLEEILRGARDELTQFTKGESLAVALGISPEDLQATGKVLADFFVKISQEAAQFVAFLIRNVGGGEGLGSFLLSVVHDIFVFIESIVGLIRVLDALLSIPIGIIRRTWEAVKSLSDALSPIFTTIFSLFVNADTTNVLADKFDQATKKAQEFKDFVSAIFTGGTLGAIFGFGVGLTPGVGALVGGPLGGAALGARIGVGLTTVGAVGNRIADKGNASRNDIGNEARLALARQNVATIQQEIKPQGGETTPKVVDDLRRAYEVLADAQRHVASSAVGPTLIQQTAELEDLKTKLSEAAKSFFDFNGSIEDFMKLSPEAQRAIIALKNEVNNLDREIASMAAEQGLDIGADDLIRARAIAEQIRLEREKLATTPDGLNPQSQAELRKKQNDLEFKDIQKKANELGKFSRQIDQFNQDANATAAKEQEGVLNAQREGLQTNLKLAQDREKQTKSDSASFRDQAAAVNGVTNANKALIENERQLNQVQLQNKQADIVSGKQAIAALRERQTELVGQADNIPAGDTSPKQEQRRKEIADLIAKMERDITAEQNKLRRNEADVPVLKAKIQGAGTEIALATSAGAQSVAALQAEFDKVAANIKATIADLARSLQKTIASVSFDDSQSGKIEREAILAEGEKAKEALPAGQQNAANKAAVDLQTKIKLETLDLNLIKEAGKLTKERIALDKEGIAAQAKLAEARISASREALQAQEAALQNQLENVHAGNDTYAEQLAIIKQIGDAQVQLAQNTVQTDQAQVDTLQKNLAKQVEEAQKVSAQQKKDLEDLTSQQAPTDPALAKQHNEAIDAAKAQIDIEDQRHKNAMDNLRAEIIQAQAKTEADKKNIKNVADAAERERKRLTQVQVDIGAPFANALGRVLTEANQKGFSLHKVFKDLTKDLQTSFGDAVKEMLKRKLHFDLVFEGNIFDLGKFFGDTFDKASTTAGASVEKVGDTASQVSKDTAGDIAKVTQATSDAATEATTTAQKVASATTTVAGQATGGDQSPGLIGGFFQNILNGIRQIFGSKPQGKGDSKETGNVPLDQLHVLEDIRQILRDTYGNKASQAGAPGKANAVAQALQLALPNASVGDWFRQGEAGQANPLAPYTPPTDVSNVVWKTVQPSIETVTKAITPQATPGADAGGGILSTILKGIVAVFGQKGAGTSQETGNVLVDQLHVLQDIRSALLSQSQIIGGCFGSGGNIDAILQSLRAGSIPTVGTSGVGGSAIQTALNTVTGANTQAGAVTTLASATTTLVRSADQAFTSLDTFTRGNGQKPAFGAQAAQAATPIGDDLRRFLRGNGQAPVNVTNPSINGTTGVAGSSIQSTGPVNVTLGQGSDGFFSTLIKSITDAFSALFGSVSNSLSSLFGSSSGTSTSGGGSGLFGSNGLFSSITNLFSGPSNAQTAATASSFFATESNPLAPYNVSNIPEGTTFSTLPTSTATTSGSSGFSLSSIFGGGGGSAGGASSSALPGSSAGQLLGIFNAVTGKGDSTQRGISGGLHAAALIPGPQQPFVAVAATLFDLFGGSLFAPGRIATEKTALNADFSKVTGLPFKTIKESQGAAGLRNYNDQLDPLIALGTQYASTTKGSNQGTIVRYAAQFAGNLQKTGAPAGAAKADVLKLAQAQGLDLDTGITAINKEILSEAFSVDKFNKEIGDARKNLKQYGDTSQLTAKQLSDLALANGNTGSFIVTLNRALAGTIDVYSQFNPLVDGSAVANDALAGAFEKVTKESGLFNDSIQGIENQIKSGDLSIEEGVKQLNSLRSSLGLAAIDFKKFQLDPTLIKIQVDAIVTMATSIKDALKSGIQEGITQGLSSSDVKKNIKKSLFQSILDTVLNAFVEGFTKAATVSGPLSGALAGVGRIIADFTTGAIGQDDFLSGIAAQFKGMEPVVSAIAQAAGAASDEFSKMLQSAGVLPDILSQAAQNAQALVKAANDLLFDETLSPLTARQRLTAQHDTFLDTRQRALLGDQQAVQDLPNQAQAYLQNARKVFASSPAYEKAFDFVRSTLLEVAKANGADLNVPLAQLNTLKEIRDLIKAQGPIENIIPTTNPLTVVTTTQTSQPQATGTVANYTSQFSEMITHLRSIDANLATAFGLKVITDSQATLPSFKEGGVITAKETLAKLHGPEVVIPLATGGASKMLDENIPALTKFLSSAGSLDIVKESSIALPGQQAPSIAIQPLMAQSSLITHQVPSFREGGLVKAKEMPAILHGPELIVPLPHVSNHGVQFHSPELLARMEDLLHAVENQPAPAVEVSVDGNVQLGEVNLGKFVTHHVQTQLKKRQIRVPRNVVTDQSF